MKRRISIGFAVVLALGVVAALVLGNRGGTDSAQLTTVRGVIGSEKLAFFSDQRVKDAFAKHGFDVQVDPAGSRQMATQTDLSKYDFAFPSSSPAADRIQRDHPTAHTYAPFSSPMAVATFAPIVDLLTKAGVVHKGAGDYDVLDVAKYMDLTAGGTRWDQLPGNTTYPVRKNILITTTDPRDSNSAAMYLAIASYVANGFSVVNTPDQEAAVLPKITPLFTNQGYTQNSSDAPFEDYLSAGIGRNPMVLVYEAQYADRLVRNDGSIKSDMRLVYLSPTVYSKHTLVALKSPGDQIGQLLTTDPELASLAATFGFRTQDPKYFSDVVSQHKLPLPTSLVDTVDPPSFETLERLLDTVGKQYGS
ncbi:hypothetical protein [Kutzneria sp. CA-103260]|uniref:hypothetical protein n=1 Tax=Kutzneria sp. CA-103260 TaxID=2802641 RepID=UPI001BA46FAB|nr:hypothetical protein [Kutzneria sp. CA-103260]QUQ65240.1 hypothetical protein JJ691_29620 [Kutzneria sp. CA-103260]